MRAAHEPPLVQLAPMEGVLDWILRDLLSEVGGLDRMVTEFVRVTDRLLPDHVFERYCPELKTNGLTAHGTPTFVQLLGGKPEWMSENAARVSALGAPGIDLNFGCPAKTVNRHDGGAALLREPRRVYDVTRAVRDAARSETPVTVKVRLGFEHKDFRREIAQAAREAGAASLVVHARTKVEMYTPPAHWSALRDMTEGSDLPTLVNGEIWSADDYENARAESGCTRVALGRGLVRTPTLGHQIRKRLDPSHVIPEFSRADFLRRFFAMSDAHGGEAFAVARLKQLLRYWQPVDPLRALWFNTAKIFKTRDEVRAFLETLTEEPDACPKSKSTPGLIVPTASERRIS